MGEIGCRQIGTTRDLQKEVLRIALRDMDVPAVRRDRLNDDDIRWLGRNLAIRNRDNDNFEAACKLIGELVPGTMVVKP